MYRSNKKEILTVLLKMHFILGFNDHYSNEDLFYFIISFNYHCVN